MNELLENFKAHVIEKSKNPDFIHHQWFVKYHLNIVEQIALELCEVYTEADRDIVFMLVWLHDYGKIIDFDDQYEVTLSLGRKKLLELGFDQVFVNKVIGYVEIMDQKESIDISKTAIEIQIISSADGCSHLVGPFFKFWWYENSHKDVDSLVEDNVYKLLKDWNRKIVFPEARESFTERHEIMMEREGNFSEKYIKQKRSD
ncbi:hypothetical protein N9J72_00285 [Candidatus Gracilibacteria bacterium]|nr:hypothetical protein [Candidatus Gracilibacteria bacterium]